MSPPPTLSSLATVPADASMQSEATITFTQPGVQPPVYVVTSLSSPPWATLELKPSEDKTPSGDFVFEQKFANVSEGSYQYKIRIGEGNWVVDDSKESATDENGNRNNVVHVKPAPAPTPLDRTLNAKDRLDRKDSTIGNNDSWPEPIPFVVVEKVEDKDPPDYGAVQSRTLARNVSKRATDPEPDFEATKKDSPLDLEALRAPEVDQVEPLDAQAPLFRHESFQDSRERLPEAALDKIEEESAKSSTDPASSEDAINTPSAESQEDPQDADELGNWPLLPHETGFGEKKTELKAPLFSHETSLGAAETDEQDEFDQGPLLPHETGFTSRSATNESGYDEDEFDAAPLLPHETGFASHMDSETTSKDSRVGSSDYGYEPEHYAPYGDHSDEDEDVGELNLAPTFSHEQDFHEVHEDDYVEPLLPHERGSASGSFSGSERSFSLSPMTYEGPSFSRDIDPGKDLFGRSTHSSFFRTRTNSSTLPDKLPRSDAEDNNLHEPGLEVFPVGREQILERVATIGHKLPEDETHAAPGSPDPSVLSQACSSVDLQTVKSYLSLASVREDEEEEDNEYESVGSPVVMGYRSRYSRKSDPCATPHPNDAKQLGFVPEETTDFESLEASGAGKTDESKDEGINGFSDLDKTTVLSTVTPALTPKALEVLEKENSPPHPESELRQRRESVKETRDSRAATTGFEKSDNEGSAVVDPPMVKSAAEKLTPNNGSESWKGASLGISILVAIGAVYYFLALSR
ncbi:hypothetical protein G6514_007158 [Epicoccum nigrum]|nr:hypothetical protein G6514_007158 [Epicoccum nigrum]